MIYIFESHVLKRSASGHPESFGASGWYHQSTFYRILNHVLYLEFSSRGGIKAHTQKKIKTAKENSLMNRSYYLALISSQYLEWEQVYQRYWNAATREDFHGPRFGLSQPAIGHSDSATRESKNSIIRWLLPDREAKVRLSLLPSRARDSALQTCRVFSILGSCSWSQVYIWGRGLLNWREQPAYQTDFEQCIFTALNHPRLKARHSQCNFIYSIPFLQKYTLWFWNLVHPTISHVSDSRGKPSFASIWRHQTY